MALSDAEVARLQVFVDAVPAGPWWRAWCGPYWEETGDD